MNDECSQAKVGGGRREGKSMEEESKGNLLYVWGYLPGACPQTPSLLAPEAVELPTSTESNDEWKDVSGGGCGFAMAISESGKLITWGSTEDQGLCYLASGKHEETPEPFPLPTEEPVVNAAAGWAHCVSVTEAGKVYTWGWKECIPSIKIVLGPVKDETCEKDSSKNQNSSVTKTGDVNTTSEDELSTNSEKLTEDAAKRRKTLSTVQESETQISVNEALLAPPCLVHLGQGVKICAVAAGGRHTLALSDMGQVWGWGYGGEGQLGLGSRIKKVSSPHLIPCIEASSFRKDQASLSHGGSKIMNGVTSNTPTTSYVKGIACGGRHSAVITENSGTLLTFGWGLHGQCGHGGTNDELRPTRVSSLVGLKIEKVAAGLWHTVCISVEGRVFAFGGNQFGQLGTGDDQSEMLPRLLNTPCLDNKQAKMVSCGARHSAIITDDGKLFCWGWNKYGQLGLGDTIDRNMPFQVSISSGHLPKKAACGWWHTLLLADKNHNSVN